jgi:hypothetical protein
MIFELLLAMLLKFEYMNDDHFLFMKNSSKFIDFIREVHFHQSTTSSI